MLIPLIVVTVLFIITWGVIGSSGSGETSDCCHDKYHDPTFVNPFHRCEITELRMENQSLRSRNYSLEARVRSLETRKYDCDFSASTKEALAYLLRRDEKPAEIKIENATVTITEKKKSANP